VQCTVLDQAAPRFRDNEFTPLRGLLFASAALLVAGAPVARADDVAVRQVVVKHEAKIVRDAKTLEGSADHLTKADAGKTKTAITKLRADITGFRTALLKVQASTDPIKKGRTLLLTSLSEQRSGLTALKTAVVELQRGDSDASVKHSVHTALKKLKAGEKDSAKAAKLFGGTSS
jgi:hypothetical protein